MSFGPNMENACPMCTSMLDSLDAVTSAETDRAQRIVTAEQDRARILGETAGSASARLLAELDALVAYLQVLGTANK